MKNVPLPYLHSALCTQSRDGYGAVERVETPFRFDRSMTLAALNLKHSALCTLLFFVASW
ncbi:MAG: hypothetical protein FWH27_00555 [Planctomycetaceae bacterium]|nr:hypothetical protein [Planctomycetaceae bacterium]